MAFSSASFLRAYGITHSDKQKALSRGWIALKNCPFCGDHNWNFAMHYNSGKSCNCWKCGSHSIYDTIKTLTNSTNAVAFAILKQYSDELNTFKHVERKERTEKREHIEACKLPTGIKHMGLLHREYLWKRNFDDKLLEEEWDLQGVGMVLGSKEGFNHRIIIPITYKNVVVSYQGRDVTGIHDRIRYKTCKMSNEIIHHKHILYGLDKVQGDSVVVTEGVTKVWRLGYGAVATFGIMWKMQQATLLKKFKNVFILFDQGEDAQTKAQELADLLAVAGKHIEIVELTGSIKDPGDLSDKEAQKLMQDLIKN